jgi:hypothetical protein
MATNDDALDLTTIDHRLATVEKEVAILKQRVEPQPGAKDQPWYLKHAGRFADDPEFEEIVRLGREIREADEFELPGVQEHRIA